MLDYALTVPTWQEGCIEEMVILKETNGVYKYAFSNSLDAINTAIHSRTGYKINFEQAAWLQNSELSISVKKLMTSYNVNYCMTINIIDEVLVAVVNMHVLDKWFSTSYGLINDKFVDWVQRDKFVLLDTFKEVFFKKAKNICKYIIDDYIKSIFSSPDVQPPTEVPSLSIDDRYKNVKPAIINDERFKQLEPVLSDERLKAIEALSRVTQLSDQDMIDIVYLNFKTVYGTN
jgi:hypothetical protein